jgi:arylsulfatase A-like enzyme
MNASSTLLTLSLVLGAANAAAATERPNIVLILADDLGWLDLGCQGNRHIETPHIDRLASQGMRFTDAYSAAPVCSPTRASILTGQAPARLRITNHIPDQERFTPPDATLASAATVDHLSTDYVTIAEHLHGAGYATAFMGKWHLAGDYARPSEGLGDLRFYPEKQGFDINLGGCALGGPPTFFDPYRIHNLPPRREGEYLPDRIFDEAIAFVRRHRNQPFFLNIWNYTVHWPMEAPAPLIAKYEDRRGPGLKDPRYAAMIEAYDTALGRLLAALDDLQIADETLVVFTSDNGPYDGVADVRPLRAAKGYLYEGGIRVPLIVRFPGVVQAGSLCREPVVSTDLFPTLLAAAGLQPNPQTPLDGEDLTPLLHRTGTLKRDALFFHYPNYAFHQSNRLGSAIRQAEYKLVENFDDGSLELFNLSQDIGETRNLAGQMPERAAEMARRLRAWRQEVDAAMPKPK